MKTSHGKEEKQEKFNHVLSPTGSVHVQNRVKNMSSKEFSISETVGKRTLYNLLCRLDPFFPDVLLEGIYTKKYAKL